MRAGLVVLSVVTWSAALHAQSTPVPVGSQFLVNSYTTSAQFRPAIAADSNGDFVVVWQSDGSSGGDTSVLSIQGQRFSASGAADGSQFQVNSYTTNMQYGAAIDLDADGNFVVVWQSTGSSGGDTSFNSIQGQRYAASGAPDGSQFQVNTYTTNYQRYPAVSSSADGDFVVVWESNGSSGGDTSYGSIQGQRYLSSGAAEGSQFQANSYTNYHQGYPAIALDAVGDFVVVWHSYGSSGDDTSSWSVQGQRYLSSGAAEGSQFQVNSYTTSGQGTPAVASSAAGDFVVVWQSYGSSGNDASYWSVQGQRYTPSGPPAGTEFQVNTDTKNYQTRPAIALAPDGDFVVVWMSGYSILPYTYTESIQGQRYLSSGAPAGSQFQVNSHTTGYQRAPVIAADSNGDFVVVWEATDSSGGDDSSWSIQGQRFRVTGDLQGKVFLDQDFDGIQDGSEPGVPGVEVELYDEAHLLRRTAVTDGSGNYFLKPKEGSWTLKFVPPSDSYDFTAQDVGGDDALDSDADPLTGETGPFDVSINVLDDTIDAGFLPDIFSDGFESNDTSAWSATFP